MQYSIPQTNPITYTVIRSQTIKSIYISQYRDLVKAFKSPNYNDQLRSIDIPPGTTLQIIRIADNQARIELLQSPDKNLQRVKFYLLAQDIGLLDLEQNK